MTTATVPAPRLETTSRDSLKQMVDALQDESHLKALEHVLSAMISQEMIAVELPKSRDFTDKELSEFDHRIDRMQAGEYLTHAQAKKRVGILS